MFFTSNFLIFGICFIFFILLIFFCFSNLFVRILFSIIAILVSICYFIIKSSTMHSFIRYLNDIVFTDSIYWTILTLSIPILLLFLKPLIVAMNNKAPLVQFLSLSLFIVLIIFIFLIVWANFSYKMYMI